MLRRIIFSVIIVAAVSALPTGFAIAQQPQVIHFQGVLTGPDGGPLRTDLYEVNFSIWDQESGGMEPEWSELQVVEVTDGLFDVFLGSVNALSADVFTHAEGESELRYLEIEVVGDGPMTPRTQIAKTPNSFVSSRVLGDVQTSPGSLKMIDPGDDGLGFEISTSGLGNSIKMMDPSDDEVPIAEISSDGACTSMKLMDPGDDEIGFDVFIGGEGNSIKMMDPGDDEVPVGVLQSDGLETSFKLIDPGDDGLGFQMSTSGMGNSIKMMDPGDDEVPVAEIAADAAKSSFKLMDPGDDEVGFDVFIGGEGNSIKMMDPGDDENSLIEMNGGVGGDASFRMFNPQPEPPAVLMEMSSAPSIGGSFRMFNPQPEPPADPLLEMNTTEFGANFAMGAPGAGGLRNEITDPKFEVNVDSDGGSLDIYDEIGKYMGLDPSPMMAGGGFYMMDPSTEETNVWIESSGRLVARKGIFGHDNMNTGNHNLVVGSYHNVTGTSCFAGGYYTQVNHNDCFVWSDHPEDIPATLQTSANNQFLVRATAGVTFFSNANMTYGVFLAPGASSWNPIMPPRLELNTRPVDGQQILAKIGQLPITYYSHKDQQNDVEHIGPPPGDFNELFAVGDDDTHVSLQDEAGVALAGVKELINIINDLKEENEILERRITELEKK